MFFYPNADSEARVSRRPPVRDGRSRTRSAMGILTATTGEIMQPPHSVTKLDPRRIPEAAEVFVDAFQEDPWARHLFRGGDPTFDRDVRNLYRALLEVRQTKGEPVLAVETDGRIVGVATIERTDTVTTLLDGASSWAALRATAALFAGAGPRAARRLMAYEHAVNGARPSEPHCYLHGLAVVRRSQGSGVGRALLDAVHEIVESDPSGIGIALDTDTPENVSLYRYFGYETTAVVDAGGFTMTCMLRRHG
jgi:GNAT superfamily N-acetyltransferase